MRPLRVDTEAAARTLAVEIRDHGRQRPVIVVGVGVDGVPIVSANRLSALLTPRIAIATDGTLLARHLGGEKFGRLPTTGAVDVYLPNTTRPVTIARGEWSEEAERSLQGMLQVADTLPEGIFHAWRARCKPSAEPLPPFQFAPAFAKAVAQLPAHARGRVAVACLKALLDRSEEDSIRVGPLPTAITGIRRRRVGDLVVLESLERSKPATVKPSKQGQPRG